MLHSAPRKIGKNIIGRMTLLQVALLLALGSMLLVACGVQSGDRRPARADDDKTGEFHRSPVTAFEQFRVDVEKTDAGCAADPADITVSAGGRINFAVQLQGGELTTTATGSTQMVGERESVNYKIEGLVIEGSSGAFGTGVTEVDLDLESGARRSYGFSAPTAGSYSILCDGDKVGTFTVN